MLKKMAPARKIPGMDAQKVKHYALAEVVLLAIFMIGLALAWALVKSRSHTLLTEPIALDGSGLSVSVPVGTGWDHTAWSYETDNSMVLLAQRRLGRQTEIEISWRYIMAAKPKTLEQILDERLTGSNAQAQPLTMPEGSPMRAAQVSTPGQFAEPTYYIAWAALSNGRALELQVIPAAPDYDPVYAETLLRDTAMSMAYQTPEEMAAGTVLLERFWRTLQPQPERHEAFLIQEGRGRTAGFFYAHHFAGTDEAIRHIEARHYDLQQFMIESTLTAGRDAEPLDWETRLAVPIAAGLRRYQIHRQENKLLVTSNFEKDKTLYLEKYILPELLVGEYAALYLQTGEASVVTLALAGTGQVVPTRFKRLTPQEAVMTVPETASTVRVEYLHAANFFDEFYFDEQGQVIGRFERQPDRTDRLWQKSDVDTLRQTFGEKFNMRSETSPEPKTYF